MKVLLHVCCGPCSTHVIEQLNEHEVTAYFYNPNIHPTDEYGRRRDAAEKAAAGSGVRFIEGPYDSPRWEHAVQGLEDEPEGGKRCEACIAFRLRQAAAQAEGCDALASTLTVGPMKDAGMINRLGKEIGAERGIRFLEQDWKKQAGFERSVELSKEIGLYRQRYCGCRFSMRSMASPKL